MPPADQATLAIAAALFGLAVGSFLNVVIYRVPAGESVVSPSSRCPACATPIRPRHNIPVVGWLVLRGRCASCGVRISPRYALVEAGTAVIFVALALRFAAVGQLAALPAFAYFAAAGVVLAFIDLDTRKLPNSIVLPSYPVLGVLLAVAAGWRHDWWSLGRAGLGGHALFGFFLLIALVYPPAMGMGDVKLAGLVGLLLGYLSWTAVIVGGFAGFVLGAVIGSVVMAARRGGRRTGVPFGPFMIAGGLLAVFAAAPLADLYSSLTTALADLLV